MFLLLLSVLGEKVYRCPLSSDYTTAPTASLGFHLDRYHFPHWQNSRDLSSPLQPTSSSSSSSPNPKLRPRSREGWSPAAGHYLGLESHNENALLINKQSDLTDKDAGMDGSLSAQTRKSQYEPLDLSVRPESVMSHSPAALVQMSGIFSNGLASSITRQLQSYTNAAAELSVKPAYQCDLLVQGTKEEMNTQNAASTGHDGEADFEKSEQVREDENDDAAKWKMLKNNVLEPEELVQASADFQGPGEQKHDKPGPWGRAVAESPISSLENLTPGQADQHQHQGGLLSFLRSQGNQSGTPASAHKASLDGGGDMEKDVTSGEHQPIYIISATCSCHCYQDVARAAFTFESIYCHLVDKDWSCFFFTLLSPFRCFVSPHLNVMDQCKWYNNPTIG